MVKVRAVEVEQVLEQILGLELAHSHKPQTKVQIGLQLSNKDFSKHVTQVTFYTYLFCCQHPGESKQILMESLITHVSE